MKVTVKQFRSVLLGLLVLVAVAFLVTAVVGLGKLSEKSKELAAVKLESKTAEAQLTSLEIAKREVEKYSYFNEIAKTVIPNDKDQARAVLTIFEIAKKSGISIASITFPTSNLGGGTAAPATGSSASAISQAKPVDGIKGLYSLELTITPETGETLPTAKTATYPKFLDFLKRIERDRRTAQITQVSIQPQNDETAPSQAINFTLTINIFIRPEAQE